MTDLAVHKVQIAGIKLALRSNLSAAAVSEIVQFIDRNIDETLKNTQSKSVQSAAILVALNLAEELIHLKNQAIDQIKGLENSVNSLTFELEHSIEQLSPIEH